jgi:hypothetical protein
MPDEIPPAPSEASDDAAKAETIRITLPAKPEQPTAKRETVRINLPGKPAQTLPAGAGPKKETTKIAAPDAEATVISPVAPPPAPTAPKPFMPAPPKPPSGLASGALKPVSGINQPPKPPSLGPRPTVPLKPAPAPTTVAKPVAPAGSGLNPPEAVTQKAAAPKKETARITLPPEGSKPAMPKATIKMQQTQPLVRQPAATMTQSGLQPSPSLTTMTTGAVPEPTSDGLVTTLSIVALIVSLASLALVFLAYSASSIS